MNYFITNLFGLYTPFLICLRAATVLESECAIQVQLFSNRMIKINNEDELCRCLEFQRPVSTPKLRRIEPCQITTSQVEGNMAISAESFCGCAGYEPHPIQQIIPIQPTFHDRDYNLDEKTTLHISTEPNFDQRDESTTATDKTAVTESENERNLIANDSKINTDKKLNAKQEKSKNETTILENIHVETGFSDKATAFNSTSINNLHNISEPDSIDSTENNKTGFDYHQEDTPIPTSITLKKEVLKENLSNYEIKGVNEPENFNSSTTSTETIDLNNDFDVKFIKNNTNALNKTNKISLNNSSESHYVDSPTNISTGFDSHKEGISMQTLMALSEDDLNKPTTRNQTKEVNQPEHLNISNATTDKIDIKSDMTKFEKNKITALNDSSEQDISSSLSSLEDVFVNKSNQVSTVRSILLSNTEQVMNKSDTTEYIFWNKTANNNEDSLLNAALKNTVHITHLTSSKTIDNENIINNSVATTSNKSFVSNLCHDESSLNYTADAVLNQLENENIQSRDPSRENTNNSTTDEENSEFNTSNPLYDATFNDNLINLKEDYSKEVSGRISTDKNKDSSEDTLNHNNGSDPFQYEKDTLVTANNDTLDYEYHSGDKEADVTQLSTIIPRISDDIGETIVNSMLQDRYSVIKAAIITLIILLLIIICGVFTIIFLYGWFFKRGSYSLVRQEGNIEMEYSYRKRQT